MPLLSKRNGEMQRHAQNKYGYLTSLKFNVFILRMLSAWRKALGERVFGNKIENMARDVRSFVPANARVVDIGTGQGLLAKALQTQWLRVTTVDIVDKSYYPDIRPVIYDGRHLPFADGSFDACLMFAVLHHAQDDRAVLREAARVAPKIVVYEDIYRSTLQKIYIKAMDSLVNKEFFGHPHHNRTDAEWRALFSEMGLALRDVVYTRTWGYIDNATYFLEKP
jgi:SAM-dependent methyltransferase